MIRGREQKSQLFSHVNGGGSQANSTLIYVLDLMVDVTYSNGNQ